MPDAPYVDRHIGGKRRVGEPDKAILSLARRQHGVVARRQLLGLGVGPDAIDFRLRRGRLISLHRAVYAAGHDALTREGRWMAAVLSGGPGAVLSHRPAAALWGVATQWTRRDRAQAAPAGGRHRASRDLAPARRDHAARRHTRDHDHQNSPRPGDHPSAASAGEGAERSRDAAAPGRSLASRPPHPLPTAPRYPRHSRPTRGPHRGRHRHPQRVGGEVPRIHR
jgi:hypothetical protein